MKFGFINIGTKHCFNNYIDLLTNRGYHIYFAYDYQAGDEIKNIAPIIYECDVIFVYGDKKQFKVLFGQKDFDVENNYHQADTLLFVFLSGQKSVIGAEKIIKEHYSRLNVRMNIYRIFLEQGKTPDFKVLLEAEKSKISDKFLLVPHRNGSYLDVTIRHRNDSRITSLNKLILDNYFNYIYVTNFTSLNEIVASMLIKNKFKLRIAESFTAGRLAATLAEVAGASNFLLESLVTYSEQSKKERLNINSKYMADYGIVSRETAFEMAKSLLSSGCDIAIATTGNAGPTAQKGGDVGKCFISVASQGKIEVYEYDFEGDREEITQSGVSHGLFLLYRKLMLAYNKGN